MSNRAKMQKKDIISEIKELVEKGHIISETHSSLARRFQINRRTVKKYLEEVYLQIPPEDLESVQVRIEALFGRLFREANEMLDTAETPWEKRNALDFLLKCVDRFTDFLERFGRKPKAPENYNIKTNDDRIDVVIHKPHNLQNQEDE